MKYERFFQSTDMKTIEQESDCEYDHCEYVIYIERKRAIQDIRPRKNRVRFKRTQNSPAIRPHIQKDVGHWERIPDDDKKSSPEDGDGNIFSGASSDPSVESFQHIYIPQYTAINVSYERRHKSTV